MKIVNQARFLEGVGSLSYSTKSVTRVKKKISELVE